MSKKMFVEVKVRLILEVDDDTGMDDLDTILSEIEYSFDSPDESYTVYDTAMMDYELKDVR